MVKVLKSDLRNRTVSLTPASLLLIAACSMSLNAFGASRKPARSSLESIQNLAKTVEAEVLKNRPARDKNEMDPEPIQNMDKKAFPAMESIGTELAKEKNFDRDIALLIVRAAEDLSTIDPSGAAQLMIGDLRQVPSMVSLMAECHESKNPSKAEKATPLKNQNAITSVGLLPLSMGELCEFRGTMKDLDRLEREGNG